MDFTIGVILAFLAQCLTFFQIQGQFISDWIKNNPFIFSFLGVPISYMFIKATHYFYHHFEGIVWPGRIIGFSLGILAFSLLSYFLLDESPSGKTYICILLSVLIVLIQVFWK